MANSPSKRAAARVALINGQPTTTSRNIAETFGRDHKNVVKRISEIECSEAFRCANFQAHPYINKQNGQTYTEYLITRDGFAFLCMGFTGAKAAQWKERYINVFNDMAHKLAQKELPAPQPKHETKPEPTPTSLRMRRFMVWYDDDGVEQIKAIPTDAAIVTPTNPDKLAEFLSEMVPQHLIGQAIATLTSRTLRLLGDHQQRSPAKKIGSTA